MRSKNNTPLAIFSGTVFAHTGRGKSLGYPTANLLLSQPIEHGIYISQTVVSSTWHPSVTFIGVPKTFTDQSVERAETHILNGSFELVGQAITVELLKFIRPIKKFPSIRELTRAIQQDVEQAKAYFEAFTN